jgi:hypothetical protein
LKEFIVRHMKVRDRDLKKVKVDINLNNEIWFRGIKKPLCKIKVRAVKKEGIVSVALAEPSDHVKFKMAREEKVIRKMKEVGDVKKKVDVKEDVSKKEVDDLNKDGVDDKVEKKEDAKSQALMDAKKAKCDANVKKHSIEGKHEKKVMPRTKKLGK